MKRHVFLIYFLLSLKLFSQVSDDFSDGNFTNNPTWQGSSNLFIVNNDKQLQLNDTKENTAYLSTPNYLFSETEWSFWIKQTFSPSANNNSRFYLTSNKQDLSMPLEGYFLQFGESGSSDAVELFRQDEDLLTSILRSEEGIISGSFTIRVKVVHQETGYWKLYLDRFGNENYILEAEGSDTSFINTGYLGIYCKYTKSNSTKIYLDEIYCGRVLIDSVPPQIEEIIVTSDSSILIYFDEKVLDSLALDTDNYFVEEGLGNPLTITVNPEASNSYSLIFKEKITNGTDYIIDISGISDLEGNYMLPVKLPFCFYIPGRYDIIINEIMADPSPVVGLPEAEYIELYNTSEKTIDLTNWILKIGSSEKLLSNVTINPSGYLILAKDKYIDDFTNLGSFYGFSTFSLTNSGQTIELHDGNHNTLIHSITYNDLWYGNSNKEDGGWSLEQINPNNLCSGSENWTASENANGGTPGRENSVTDDQILIPVVTNLEVVSNRDIRLHFNQKMNKETLLDVENYTLDHGYELTTSSLPENESTVCLVPGIGLQNGIIYSLRAGKFLENCVGIPLKTDTIIRFGLPEKPDYHDIVINEILFNPLADGKDYVEIYNRSEKIIDLQDLMLGSRKEVFPNPADTTIIRIMYNQKQFLPGEFALLTSSVSSVLGQYYSENPKVFYEISGFPSYNNDAGHVVLMDRNKVVIDTFSYSEELHFPLLNYLDGVSLERINPDVFLYDNRNWHSASQNSGFGTPGYQNSQYNKYALDNTNIVIKPEIFTPNNDGVDDVQSVNYIFDEPGNVVTVLIFNSDGYLIKELVSNEYGGISGSFSWDGTNEYGLVSGSGIYVYLITTYNANGSTSKTKKTGVLAVSN